MALFQHKNVFFLVISLLLLSEQNAKSKDHKEKCLTQFKNSPEAMEHFLGFTKFVYNYYSSPIKKSFRENPFEKASKKYQIPIPVMKTFYYLESGNGKIKGQYFIWEYLDYSNKSALKKICKEAKCDVKKIRGSKSGAFGYMGFLPRTWRLFSIDCDDDSIKDPWNEYDAACSVANFLSQAGWHKNMKKAVYIYNNDYRFVRYFFNIARKQFNWDGKAYP